MYQLLQLATAATWRYKRPNIAILSSGEKGNPKKAGPEGPAFHFDECTGSYFICLETNLVISNIETFLLPPKILASLSSALIMRRLMLS